MLEMSQVTLPFFKMDNPDIISTDMTEAGPGQIGAIE
jgi:hypothetical protein